MIDTHYIQNFAIGAATTIPIIVAITQAFKMTNWIKDKYVPFLSMIIGIVVAMFLTKDFAADLSGTIMLGILFGLSASGLYSGVKSSTQTIAYERAQRAQKAQQSAEKKAQKTDKCK